MKTVSVFGSTGSIGCQALEILALYPDQFKVDTLVAGRNVQLLIAQALKVNPRVVVIADTSAYVLLKDALQGTTIEVMSGEQALLDCATSTQADLKIMAIMGIAGLRPTFAAVSAGGVVGLANKESLVCGGDLVMAAARQAGTMILPIDSEHNSLFQVVLGYSTTDIEKLTITASGGPYWSKTTAQMAEATIASTLNHNYAMGREITVNSATMMNKGFELVETVHLFGVPASKIEILVHPEQLIHGMAAYKDGSTLAALASHDMKVPLSFVLGWPHRLDGQARPFDLAKVGTLSFYETDDVRFPALRIIRECLGADDGSIHIVNAANEYAVSLFLDGHIRFLDIMSIVEETLGDYTSHKVKSIDEALALDVHIKTNLMNQPLRRIA